MKVIEPKVELIKQNFVIEDIGNDIERAARICYASEKKDTNQDNFLNSLWDKGHQRPFEFGTVYITIDHTPSDIEEQIFKLVMNDHYTHKEIRDAKTIITTNMRVMINCWECIYGERSDSYTRVMKFLKSWYRHTPYHDQRITFHWTISRGIADEFRTHTMISSLMQSTRYCNYHSNKFSQELTFVKPTWFIHNTEELTRPGSDLTMLESAMLNIWRKIEIAYMASIELGMQAQEARDMLPLGIKTEFIQCAFECDWDNFFKQRVDGTTGKPHPDALYIASQAKKLYNEWFYSDQNGMPGDISSKEE